LRFDLVRTLRAFLIPLAVVLFTLPGCREEDVIKKEEVTHEDREALRLRVAFITRDKTMWFFRLTGPADLVKQNESAFEDLVKTVTFDDKKSPSLQFTEPKGWKADPWQFSQMTNGHSAVIRLKAKPKELEILVSELSAKGFDIVDNMHRWQKKVNVPLVETFQEAQAMVKREDVNGLEINWVDMTGLGVHSVSKPALTIAQNKKAFLPQVGGPQKKANGFPFTYKAPEKWKQKPPRNLIIDAFEVAEGNESAETTVSMFGGGIGANISRWRGQVGLPKVDDAELERSALKRKVAGIDSFYVDLDNPRGPAGANRILAAIVPVGGQLMFVKMTGPRDLVGQQKNAFETFLDSFQREGK